MMGGRGNAAVRNNNYTELKSNVQKALTEHYTKYWNGDERFVKSDVERAMGHVNEILDYFKDKELIEKSASYEDEIVWRFSGKDRQTKKFAGFEFDSLPTEKSAKETLSGNGYSITDGLLYPKPIFDYLMNHTNVTDSDREAAKAISVQALKEYKKRRK